VATAAALLTTAFGPSLEATPPVATLVGGATSGAVAGLPPALERAGSTHWRATARFPLRLRTGVSADQLVARLVDVRLGERRDEALREMIREPRLVSEGSIAHLLVEADPLAPHGTYSLVIDLVAPTDEAGGETQTLELQMVLPAAKLTTAAAVTLRHVGGETVRPALELVETGGRSSIGELRAPARVPLLDEHSVPTSASLTIELPDEVPAGGSAGYDLDVVGDPPLGNTTAGFLLRSPHLAEPQAVTVTVLTRRSSCLLVFLIFLGVGTGYLVRKVLVVVEQHSRAELQAGDVSAELKDERTAGGDPEFVAALEGLEGELDEARRKPPAEAMEATKSVQQSLETLLEELEGRMQAASKRRAELVATLRDAQAEDLPEFMFIPLATAVRSLDETANKMGRAQFAASETKHREIQQKTAAELRGPAETWARAIEKQVLQLGTLNSGLAESQKSLFLKPELLTAATELADDADQLQLAELLSKSAEIFEAHRGLAIYLRVRVVSALGEAMRNLRLLGSDKPGFDELAAMIADFESRMETADDAKAILDAFADRHVPLDRALRRAILAHVDDDERSAVSGRLCQGGFAAELRRLVGEADATRVPPAKKSRWIDVAFAAESPREILPHQRRHARPSRESPLDAPAAAGAARRLPPVNRALALRQIFLSRLVQTVVAMALIVFGGYFLWQPEWVGTGRQCFGIFLWGFGLDVTIDQAFAVASGVAKPPS
jgi:hypothetical protein